MKYIIKLGFLINAFYNLNRHSLYLQTVLLPVFNSLNQMM